MNANYGFVALSVANEYYPTFGNSTWSKVSLLCNEFNLIQFNVI